MKVTVGQLKRLIKEELAAEPDPFKPPQQAKPDLRQFAKNVIQCEELLGDMPKVIGDMSKGTQNLKAQNMLRKAAGLAYHGLNDLKALEAILTIVVKEMRKN